jgi:hypothetical protein
MVCRIALQHNEAQVGVDFVRREDQYERTATIPALIEDRASKSTLHRNGRGIALRKLPKLGLNKKGTGVLLLPTAVLQIGYLLGVVVRVRTGARLLNQKIPRHQQLSKSKLA